jgi:hypothetical protein
MSNNVKLDWVFRTSNTESQGFFWGDDAPWTSMLSLAWATIDSWDFTVRPRAAQARAQGLHSHAIAAWTAVIHLLGLGLGWTDLRAGLATWRLEGYREELHPILDSVKRILGDEIEALEIYFGVADREIIASLREIQATAVVEQGEIQRSSNSFDPYLEKARNLLARRDRKARSLGFHLLDGGDALHLESHLSESFLERGFDLMGSQIRKDFGNHSVASMAIYHGWAHRLAMQTRSLHATEIDDEALKTVEVKIQRLGSLGTFVFDADTSRWFRYSEEFFPSDFQQQRQVHRWGNIPNLEDF